MSNHDLIGIPGGASRLTTPALVIDRAALQRNIDTMARRAAAAGLALRPHAKTHKSSAIGRLQLDAGAVGLCCATPHEAVALLRAGLANLLLTSPVAQPRQAHAVVAALARTLAQARADAPGGSHPAAAFGVVVDSMSGVELWEQALAGTDLQVSALVDLDIGMHRTGVASAGDAVALARRVHASPCLIYRGVQAYSGLVQHIAPLSERERVYTGHLRTLAAMLEALRQAGMPAAVVSGGGTGSFPLDAECRLFTESQAGSYVFMDVEYGAIDLDRAEGLRPFDVSIWLRSHVISHNHAGHATVDAGTKSLSADSVVPQVRDRAGWIYEFFGDEYGRVRIPMSADTGAGGAPGSLLGRTLDFVLPHCDPTVNLHDVYHVVDGDTLSAIWPIDGRGVLTAA